MSLPVSLREVVDHLELINRECTAYINRKTGDLRIITDEELYLADDEGEPPSNLPDCDARNRAEVRDILASEDYIALPDSLEINDWSRMKVFAAACENPDDRTRLLDTLRGRSAFGRFRAVVEELGMLDAWYRFRTETLADLAADFLDENGIPYRRD